MTKKTQVYKTVTFPGAGGSHGTVGGNPSWGADSGMQQMRAVADTGHNNSFEIYLYKLVPGAWETLCLIDRALSLATQTYLTGKEQGVSQASAVKPRFPSCRQAAYHVPLNPWREKDSGGTWIWNEIVYWACGRSVRLSSQQHFGEKLSVPRCPQAKICML